MKKKRVVVKHMINVVHEVPDEWTEKDVDFYFNDSLHCANSLRQDLSKLRDGACLCEDHSAFYLRDATEQDLEVWNLTGEKC